MLNDDPFVPAIRASWLDRTTRLAYADWLEDRSDTRAELVRVCEQMRDESVWSDRYWELKARRNELWRRVPLDWLEATGYDGGYYDPIFRDGVPRGPRARWRLIREFTERWHGVAVPDVGGQRDAVQSHESRLGLTLPPSVREFVAFVHDLDNHGWSRSEHAVRLFHCAVGDLRRLTGHPALGLIDYSLGGQLGVALEALTDPDPCALQFGVRWSGGTEDDGQPPSRVAAPERSAVTVSLAVFHDLFTELPTAGSMHTFDGNPCPDPDALLAKLVADLPIHARFDDTDVFESDELLVVVRGPRRWRGGSAGRGVVALVRRPIPIAAVPGYLFGGENWDVGWSGVLDPEWFRLQQDEDRPAWYPPPRWRSVLERMQVEGAKPPPSGEPSPWAPRDGGESAF